MYLILSQKVSQKLKKESVSKENFVPDIYTWRVDSHKLVRRTIFIITHELSLYTCVTSYQGNLKGIVDRLSELTKEENLTPRDLEYVKFTNQKVTSSMNNIKRIIFDHDKYYPASNQFYEEMINNIPFKFLSFRKPTEVYNSIIARDE